MAPVRFEVRHRFDAPGRAAWDELVDWKGHEAWIPATRVEIDAQDPTAVGTEFVAYSGYGPLTLEDRMVVATCEWDDETRRGDCTVTKLGPVLTGRAGFTVTSEGTGCVVAWFEDVDVRLVPRVLGPLLGWFGALGFRLAMRRLGGVLRTGASNRRAPA